MSGVGRDCTEGTVCVNECVDRSWTLNSPGVALWLQLPLYTGNASRTLTHTQSVASI